MRTVSDRCVGEIMSFLERNERERKKDAIEEQAEKRFKLTLEKLWPLKETEPEV